MIMQMSLVDKIKRIKTSTSLRHPVSFIELWQKYSNKLHACSVTTQSLLSQVKGHRSVSKVSRINVHATNTYPVTAAD